MTLKQIAEAIAANVASWNAGKRTFIDFANENCRLWRLANRGEPCIVGSAAHRRTAKVQKYLNGI